MSACASRTSVVPRLLPGYVVAVDQTPVNGVAQVRELVAKSSKAVALH